MSEPNNEINDKKVVLYIEDDMTNRLMLKKLLITGGIALVGYVVNEVRKQYDKNVEDYNNLLDRYNELSDSINNGNFYNNKKSNIKNDKSRYVTEIQTMSDGSKCKIKKDLDSGISIISVMDA